MYAAYEMQRLVQLYAERGSPKYEKAALRWRYLTEGSPTLQHFAEITASLAQREYDADCGRN